MILAIFDLQVTPMLPTKSTGLSVQEKKQKIDFQDGCHGGHLGYPTDTILAIFDLRGCIKKYVDFYYNFKTTQRKSIKFCTRIKQLNVKRIIGFTLMYYTCV